VQIAWRIVVLRGPTCAPGCGGWRSKLGI
jgi:hypothetical protein